MRQNALLLWILGLIVMAAAMSGCGGSNSPFRGETDFIGSYSGNWSVTGAADVGVMTLTVAPDSTMRGTFANSGTGETGRVVGATHPDGLFNATFIVDGTNEQIAITGTMVLDSGFLSGDAVFTRPGQSARGMNFSLSSTLGPNPLAGSFGATWSVFSANENGIMNLTISPTGVVSGQWGDITTGESGIATGSVLNNGHFDMFFIVDGTQTRITVRGEMIRVSEPALKWQGTGTFQRPGAEAQGFQFTSNVENGG